MVLKRRSRDDTTLRDSLSTLDWGEVLRRAPVFVLGFLCVCACVGSALYGGIFYSGYQPRHDRNVATYKEVQKTYDDLTARKNQQEEYAKKFTYSASSLGAALATYQNSMWIQNSTSSPDDIVQASRYLDGDVRALLGPWVTVTIDYATKDPIDWTFMSTQSTDVSTFPVLWQLRRADGTVLAYMTATYTSETDKFSNFSFHTTDAGRALFATLKPLNTQSRDHAIDRALAGENR